MSDSRPPSDHSAAGLIERLHAVRQQNEGLPAPERRAALMRELDLQLASLSPGDRPALVEQALGAIRPATPSAGGEGSAGDGKLRSQFELARAEKEALAKERDALRATRDALLRENAKMRGELDHLRVEVEAKAAAPAGSAASGAAFDAFRAGLKDAIAGKKVDLTKVGLPANEIRLFRLTQELVNFIFMLERGRIAFLNAVEVGQAGMMGTQLLKGYQDQVRKQIVAVLNDEEGSIKNLRKTLDAQNRFMIGVPDAFQGAFPKAVEALLERLAPEPILARSKKLLTDYEKAWGEFVRTHSDLSNLTPEELWDSYFKAAFKAKLSDWTKSEG